MILSTTDEIMGALEKGDLSKDFAEKFREVLEAVSEQEASGTLTLKLKISAKGDMVSIKSKLDTVLPSRERRTSTFFHSGDGRLSLQHPDQIQMFEDRKRERAASATDV